MNDGRGRRERETGQVEEIALGGGEILGAGAVHGGIEFDDVKGAVRRLKMVENIRANSASMTPDSGYVTALPHSFCSSPGTVFWTCSAYRDLVIVKLGSFITVYFLDSGGP